MATNPFGDNLVSTALDEERKRLALRARGILPGQEPSQEPAASPPQRRSLDISPAQAQPGGQPGQPQAAIDPRKAVEDIARRSRVPVNILMSIGEASGASGPEDSILLAQSAASKLAPLLAQGMSPEQALASVLGDNAPPEAAQMILTRAKEIGAALYAPPPEPGPEPSVVRDTSALLAKGVIGSGIGGAIRGAGELVASLADTVNKPINVASRFLTGQDALAPAMVPGKETADALKSWADSYFGAMVSDEAKQAIKDSRIGGDPLKPSTWTLGENPSLRGITYQAIDVFGSLLPVVIAGMATGPVGAISVGASQSAGDQAQSSDDTLQAMFDTKLPDGQSQLEAESELYRSLIAKGATPEQALERTKAEGARMAALIAAPIGALGGKFTSKIIDPATKVFDKSGIAKRVAGRAALGFAEEGSQEFAEVVGGRLGTNLATGTQIDPTKDTLGDLILGGIAGGATGAGAGLMSRRHDPQTDDPAPPPPSQEDAPLGLPAPPITPPPPSQTLRLPPPGPISAALAAAPKTLTDFAPGTPLRIDIGTGGSLDASFVGETAMGVEIREADGSTIVVPHEEITSGAVTINPLETPKVTPDAIIGHANTRLSELEAKVAVGGKLTPQENDQMRFLAANLDNPPALAQAFGAQITEGTPDANSGDAVEPSGLAGAGPQAAQAGNPVESGVRLGAGVSDGQAPSGGPALPDLQGDGQAQPRPPSTGKPAGNLTPPVVPPVTPLVTPPAADQPAESGWWGSLDDARAMAANVGFARVDVGDAAWNDLPRLKATVNARLTEMGHTDWLAPEDANAATAAPEEDFTNLFLGMFDQEQAATAADQAPQEAEKPALTYAEQTNARNAAHRDAITAIEENRMEDFAKFPAEAQVSAIGFTIEHRKGFSKKAPALLKAAGIARPADADIEAYLGGAKLTNTQQGEALSLPPSNVPGMREWAQVYLDSKAWYPFKGAFRQPTKAFKDWLEGRKTPPTDGAAPPLPKPEAQQQPLPPADAGPADTKPSEKGQEAQDGATDPKAPEALELKRKGIRLARLTPLEVEGGWQAVFDYEIPGLAGGGGRTNGVAATRADALAKAAASIRRTISDIAADTENRFHEKAKVADAKRILAWLAEVAGPPKIDGADTLTEAPEPAVNPEPKRDDAKARDDKAAAEAAKQAADLKILTDAGFKPDEDGMVFTRTKNGFEQTVSMVYPAKWGLAGNGTVSGGGIRATAQGILDLADLEARPLPPVPTPDVASYWNEATSGFRASMARLAGLNEDDFRSKRWKGLSAPEQRQMAATGIEQIRDDAPSEIRAMWQGVLDSIPAPDPAPATSNLEDGATTKDDDAQIDALVGDAPPAADPAPTLSEVVDDAAAQADPNPTPTQAEAGNYQHGHTNVQGLDIAIETEKGKLRTGTAPDGTAWKVKMPAHYGRFKGTVGADGDQVDVYIGDAPDSDFVLTVDQKDLGTDAFDEHKVIIGTKTEAEAIRLYKKGFSDGKGAARMMGTRAMTIAELKAALADAEFWKKPAALPPVDEAEAGEGGGRKEKIKDFGGFIGGQRKNAARNYVTGLGGEINPKGMGLSDIFPIPDYEALAANGASAKVLAAVALIRRSIPRKKPRAWGNDFERTAMAARAIAQGLLAGNIDPDVEMPRLRDWKNSPDFTIPAEALETYPLFARLAPENLGYAVANMAVRQGRYPRVDGQETRFEHVVGTPGGHVSPYTLPPEPEVPVLNPEGYDILAAKATAQIEAVRAAMAARDEGADQDSEKQEAPIEFTVRNYRSGGAAVFITKPKLVAVTKKFNNPSEARQYLKNNREALEAKVRRLMQGPNERRAENRVRTGPVWRMGDATEAMFLNELGFRGVAFGKSTTADERQSRMNDTYDAMMDLAGILNVPPKMLSLNGRLGLGFGTHGKGGKGHWAGVFMQAPGNPDTDQTIAFVRKGGAGVLAHEWFHAIDNFLARHDATESNVSAALTNKKAENRTDFMSDRPRNRGKLTDSQYQAFRALRAALTGSDWKTRMDAYDKMRAEPYWGTTIELAARAFERMIVDQLYQRDMSNDFLANVDDTSGAYLTTREFRRSGIGKAFDDVLSVIAEVLDVKGETGPALPPVIEDRRPRDPAVGDTWESGDGWREITAYDPAKERFTVTDRATGAERIVYADQIEELMEGDAWSLTDAGRAEADEKRAIAEASEAAQEERRKKIEDEAKKRESEAGFRERVSEAVKDFLARPSTSARAREHLAKVYRWTDDGGVIESRAHNLARTIESGGTMGARTRDGKYRGVSFTSDKKGYTVTFTEATYTREGVDFAEFYYARWQAQKDKEAAHAAVLEAMATDIGYRQDNPGGSWLVEKIAIAEEAMAKGGTSDRAKGFTGPVTGYFTKKLFLPTATLARIKGANDEVREPGNPKFDELMAEVERDGFKEDQTGNAIVVGVNHKGQAFILEGNTRVAVAKALGVKSLRAEVRYFNGGETDAKGELSPLDVYKISTLEGPGDLLPKAKEANAETAEEDFTDLFLGMFDEESGEKAEGAEGAPEPLTGKPRQITDAFLDEFRSGRRFQSIVQARKRAGEAIGREVEVGDYLMVEEAIELAVVLRARELVDANRTDPVAVYAELIDLYNAQPILGERTPDKMRYQAYSTPAPLAYVVSRLAGVGSETRLVEPTAGNGMLAIEAAPANVQANELQPSRAAQLATSLPGAALTTADALDMTFAPFDVLITNPPFGKLTDQETQTRKSFSLGVTTTKEIDHAIAWHVLSQMPEDGRAVLILGGVKKQLTGADRAKAYQERGKTVFFKQLYDTFNVVDHFTVAGDLYGRQGAAWPVDVIVIDGKAQSQRDYPMKTAPEVLSTWVEIGRKLDNAPDVDTTGRGPAVGGGDPAGTSGTPDKGPVSGPVGGPDRNDDREGGGGSKRGPRTGGTGGSGPRGPRPSKRSDDAGQGQRGAGDGAGGSRRPDLADPAGADGQRPGGAGGSPGNRPLDVPAPPVLGGQTPTPPRTAGEAAASAAANIKGGTADILAGIRAALAAHNPNKLNSGFAFLPELYEALKPAFISAVRRFGNAAQDIADIVRAMVRGLMADGMTKAEAAEIAPYANRFIQDVKAGRIAPFKDEPPKAPNDDAPAPKQGENEFQASYKPRSKAAFVVGTFAPRAMQDAMDRALRRIAEEEGDIDAYVARELGYTLEEAIGADGKEGYFSAEQMDALAMAIKNVDAGKGFIIGDQTGVGKGRFVAAMLRYGERKGRIPVFVTQKPGLYADMVRDLRDIGMADAQGRIIATNSNMAAIPISGADDLFVGPSKKEIAALNQALINGKLPEGKSFLFTTYDQMTSLGEKRGWPARARALLAASDRLMLVLDESHTAGGSDKPMMEGPRQPGQPPRNRAEFFRDLVKDAAGTVFSSATYAKNPTVMSLYASTNLSLAVDNIDTLGTAIEAGGVPVQQIIANQLTADGQYVRREKSFDGIEFASVELDTNRDQAAKISEAITALAEFDRSTMEPLRIEAQQAAAAGGFINVKDTAVGVESASSVGFANVVHNLANQFLLALRIEESAKIAIEAWKAGEKPVLTLMNVNGSILSEAIEAAGAKAGDAIDLPFNIVIERYLERLRTFNVKTVSDEVIPVRLTDEDIGAAGLAELERLRTMIRDLPLKGLSGSPVDAILDRLKAAGMKVGEITGRLVSIEGGVVTPRKSTSADNKRRMNEFNSGALDALVISASGSTGFSLHATGKPGNDGKPRHMIVLQAHADINVFMQTLGRVNRTGQIVLPRYTLAFSNLAIEKRFAAILMKKLASLNANTTAGKRGATTLDVTDFVNQVGDQVVKEFLLNDDYLSLRLGLDINDRTPAEGLAAKATGRLIYLPPDEVDGIFESIEAAYKDRIFQLEQEGRNPLEAKTLDLRARVISRSTIRQGGGSASELDQDTIAELSSILIQGSPHSPDKVRNLVGAALGGLTDKAWLAEIRGTLEGLMPGHMSSLVTLLNNRTEAKEAAEAALDAARRAEKAANAELAVLSDEPFGWYRMGSNRIRAGDKVVYNKSEAATVLGQDEKDAYKIVVQTADGKKIVSRNDLTLIEAAPEKKPDPAALAAADKAAKAAGREVQKRFTALQAAEAGVTAVQSRQKNEKTLLENVITAIGGVTPGTPFSLTLNGGEAGNTTIVAVPIGVDVGKVGTNPTAASRIRVRFAVADATREISVPLSQVMNQSGGMAFTQDPGNADPYSAFKSNTGERREERIIITGNLLAGVEAFRTAGQATFFTDESGAVRPGILMPRGFDMANELRQRDVTLPTPELAAQFISENEGVLKSGDKLVSIKQDGWRRFKLTVQKGGGRGTPYFMLEAAQPHVTNFRAKGKAEYEGMVSKDALVPLLKAYSGNLGATWLTESFKDEARALTGEVLPGAVAPDGAKLRRTESRPDPTPDTARMKAVRDDLEAELRRTGIADRVSLDVVPKLLAPVSGGIWDAGEEVEGYFVDDRIAINAGRPGTYGGPMATLRHEIIHALRDPDLFGGNFGIFTETEWRSLVAVARRSRSEMAWARRNYPDLDHAGQIEEAIAELYWQWADGRETQGPIAALFERIRAVFEAIASALDGNGFNSSSAVFKKIASGEMGRRAKARDEAGYSFAPRRIGASNIDWSSVRLNEIGIEKKFRLAKGTDANGRVIVTDADEKNLIEQAITQAMGGGRISALGLVPGRPLFKELGAKLQAAASYLRFKEKMDTLRDEWHSKADTVAQKWRKIAMKNGAANGRLMDLMHESTLAQQDPTKPFHRLASRLDYQKVRDLAADSPEAIAAQARIDKDQKRRSEYADLVKAYNALPPAFQAMYVEARDSYTALADATEQAILDNVSKAMRINIRKAERRYEDEMQRIRDDGLIGGERTQAIEAADAALARARARLGWGARARMISLRQQFESNRLEGPYFPLSRFGEFFATVRDANGVVTNFSRFESVKDRDRMAAIERRKPGQTVEVGVVSDANLRDMVDPTFVAEVEAILGDAGVSDDIMDEVWQKWLATLPEMSVRKNRIHRKGTAGFDKDAFRSFGNHLFHGAHQLARVTFTMDMTDALEEAKREAARRPDATRQGLIVKEMERRHEYTMNPKGAWWSQVLTQAAFVWYLALTPAAAIVNLTQTTIVGIPVMSTLNPGKGGMGQASRQLNRALLDFTRGRGKIMQSNRLTEDEKAAMKEAYDRGTIDKSQAHDLAAVAESGTEYSPVRTKVMGVISYFFHHTERMNREITFLASYRMAKANGAAPAEAIEKAADITWKTHFDYQNTSRPRIMQGDVARVALTFRNFQVNLLWRLFRDTHQAINGESAKERTEARKQLAGITGMMMLHAGLSGTWLFGLSMAILGLFMDDADDPEEEVKRLITETLGADVGGALFYGIPGYMSGIDLTARIGMPDLWFRSPDRAVEGEEAYNHWLKQVVGAVPSIAESFFRGGAKMSDGEYQRGAEMMVPKAVRDILKTYRYATEGVVTAKGDPLIDTLPSYGLIVQALGFTPAEIAERFDFNSRLYERQEQILDARSKVLAEAAKIVGAGKPLTDEVLAQINAFNAENPDYPITGDTIVRSVRARQQARDRAEFGATLNPRLNDRLRAERAPMVFAGG